MIIESWRREGMMGGAKAHYDGIVAFSETDFTYDFCKTPPSPSGGCTAKTIRRSEGSLRRRGTTSAKASLENGTLKTYKG